MTRLVTLASRAMIVITSIGIIAMLLMVTADVLMRALFNIALPGVDAIVASYLMVATIFLPLALLHLLEENIAVDALRDNVPDVFKDLFDIIGHLLSVIFYALLGWLYFKVAIDSFAVREFVTGTWNVPIWPARVFMPIGLGLASLAALVKLIESLRALFSGSKPSSSHTAGSF